MSLQAFLNSNPIDNVTEEVLVSNRFKDEKGNIIKFKVKALTGYKFDEIRKSATIMRGKKVEFDAQSFNAKIIINNTIEPNFKDAKSLEQLGCKTPEEYLDKVLLAGEQITLSDAIQKISGFDSMDNMVEEAKN